ncbi:MAG: Crp/Fnr family transcriptional regulator [Rudaea sp.]
MPAQRAVAVNQLLAALPAAVRASLLADCTRVELVLGSVLYGEGEPMRHIYFPIDSFISMLKTIDDHSTLEVGMIGNEGMCGYSAVLGQNFAPLHALTQGAGSAWRMKIATFRRRLKDTPALRRHLYCYVDVLLRQLAQTAACTRFHVVEERLARWLLMTRDRAHADSFDVTQEFLAFMLGVRRVGVTSAAGVLQSRKLIRYRRGNLTILDRERLEAAACACYRSDLEIYRRGMAIVHKP